MFLDVDVAVEVPVSLMPLIDDTDFKTRKVSVAYDAAGMALWWNFVTSAGVVTLTVVTPTSGGVYDWVNKGAGMYAIEIPASGGGSINNDTEGYGWFAGVATGVLPWRGPVVGFRAAALNNALCDGGANLSVTVANDGITAASLASDVTTELQSGLATAANLATVAGYLDTEIAAILADTNELQTDWANGGRLDLILDARASQTSVDDLPTNAELATALGAADDAVLAQVALVKAVTDKLDDTLEDDAGTFRFTANALEESPTGGSAPTASAIADEVQTRTIAAVTVVNGLAANVITAAATAADFTTEIQSGLATAAAVADLPTNAELATALAAADDAVLSAIDAVPTATENADALLNRDMSAVSDTNDRSPLNALRFLRNKWSLAGTTLTVTKEDDTAAAWTATVTAAPGADPISGSDPA
jgi:hypothetical protein